MILIKQISKAFGPILPVKDFSLELTSGERCCLIGPTGSGKTTLLRLIAGFEQPDQGEIFIGGRLVSSRRIIVSPHERKIGMVFQNLALWPHQNLLKHLLLVMDSYPDQKRKEEMAREILGRMGLEGISRNYPTTLSGGQRQKLAIARMMSSSPAIALLDEPFSHLDPDSKAEVRGIVQEWIARNRITLILVTHDPLEDFSYFDTIAMMNKGGLVYRGGPEDAKSFIEYTKTKNKDRLNV